MVRVLNTIVAAAPLPDELRPIDSDAPLTAPVPNAPPSILAELTPDARTTAKAAEPPALTETSSAAER